MPQIIVKASASEEQQGAIVFQENVQPEHLASEHHAAQLLERVGWAVTDAKDAEEADRPEAEAVR